MSLRLDSCHAVQENKSAIKAFGDSHMRQLDLCKRYLALLSQGDLERVLQLFEPDAKVVSPHYGTLDARAYHERFFADTDMSRAIGRIVNTYQAMKDTQHIALHFHYTWVRKDGKTIVFDCMNLYDLNADLTRFTKITRIYDTAVLQGRLRSID